MNKIVKDICKSFDKSFHFSWEIPRIGIGGLHGKHVFKKCFQMTFQSDSTILHSVACMRGPISDIVTNIDCL